jgi:hypothetical protein
MLDGLRRKWKLRGGWQLIDIPNDYFVVKFNLEEDANHVLCGGPWILAGQTLVVQRWRPDFDPLNETISRMALWVRINGLPVKYFNESIIAKIGSLIGTVVKVDQLTLAQARGMFARVCVEIDLEKPLKPFVEVESGTFGIVYEGLSMVCFGCGCYGHVKDKCPNFVAEKEKTDGVPTPTQEESREKQSISISDSIAERDTTQTFEIGVNSEDMGPWMLMAYKNRKKKVDNPSSSKKKQLYWLEI